MTFWYWQYIFFNLFSIIISTKVAHFGSPSSNYITFATVCIFLLKSSFLQIISVQKCQAVRASGLNFHIFVAFVGIAVLDTSGNMSSSDWAALREVGRCVTQPSLYYKGYLWYLNVKFVVILTYFSHYGLHVNQSNRPIFYVLVLGVWSLLKTKKIAKV